MESRQWVNPSQPQTLTIACFLLYINAVFAVLDVLQIGVTRLTAIGAVYYFITIVGGVVGGHGIATERKWGYGLAIVVALVPFVLRLVGGGGVFGGAGLITLIFEIALVALLLHPQSRSYQKIWFR